MKYLYAISHADRFAAFSCSLSRLSHSACGPANSGPLFRTYTCLMFYPHFTDTVSTTTISSKVTPSTAARITRLSMVGMEVPCRSPAESRTRRSSAYPLRTSRLRSSACRCFARLRPCQRMEYRSYRSSCVPAAPAHRSAGYAARYIFSI